MRNEYIVVGILVLIVVAFGLYAAKKGGSTKNPVDVDPNPPQELDK